MENQINGTPKATFYLNELASEMTALFIEIKYEGESVNLYDTEKDEDDNGELRYTEKIQEEFDAVYDEVFQYLESNQIK
jgi:hypothetical protein